MFSLFSFFLRFKKYDSATSQAIRSFTKAAKDLEMLEKAIDKSAEVNARKVAELNALNARLDASKARNAKMLNKLKDLLD